MQSIPFNKTGYEPFLDYIKAFAIICVLIGHTFPYLSVIGYGLWAGMQVPLFVLVQSFHSLKKPEVKLNWPKLFWRIICPWLLVEATIFSLLGMKRGFDTSLIFEFVNGGGGPGSYFPWIYLQIAIILKFIRPMFDDGSRIKQTIVAVGICEVFEVLCSLTNLPDWIYRVLAVRYFFLIFLAWIWVKDGIRMTKTNWTLSILSAASIVYFEYFASDTEPFFYDTAWKFHRWPCYFYVAFLLTCLLYQLHRLFRRSIFIDRFVKTLSKCSYEIFLVQMMVCKCMPLLTISANKYINYGFKVVLIFVVSIYGGLLFHTLYNKSLSRIKVSI